MEYFLITKTNKKTEASEKINLAKGFVFEQKTKITMYNRYMIKYILTKKFNSRLKSIINFYIMLMQEDADNEDAGYAVQIKIETLRNLLLEKYSPYLDKKTTENYLDKLSKFEEKTGGRRTHKKL